MEHTKKHHSISYSTKLGQITIEGPIPRKELEKYEFHSELTAFRPAPKQFEALLDIAEFPEGRIIVARTEDTIIGYVTYLHPDPLERWSTFNMEVLIELGAIEIIPAYRGARVASNLLKVSMMDNYMENYIIISTEYYWHWDLEGTNLSIWEYRKVMEKMMAAGGLLPAPTDDPEIISHPANCLMVRTGKNVTQKSIEQFDVLRFLGRSKYRNMREGL
ncbi:MULTISPECIES: GNAT family N-acetyltransferase [Oceanobacillus]|uniref:Acetoin utilization protein AcuA n=1 Tax=Oceanobacillus kimchii TaxID=746691 RepID=A0ABQ5TKP2_9BACI|nr:MULTISPECIES: GNAT family N-acetyltransferase [Oceanobacillus]MBT2600780.1 GNAT family N-acetyltransferase [Oceanobacillus sp. ISL-74]MBT2650823.1 GNAT family N-acetyltransferase [Oceanobacillus sp. ISL-73]MCT1575535.1 GNAT family N-acetyltransferase [Oceanobacillus kimchii]MCT2137166.1 GNAT family N-acetyltransferase [Oceanobacillus kimchii]OEH55351.1 acetoin dehydrogenase [Oceanobacillus sp. E9]